MKQRPSSRAALCAVRVERLVRIRDNYFLHLRKNFLHTKACKKIV